ncbi:VapE domain-containing protein [Leclercia sp. Marseille-Q4284]|uniref:VapE domain-containing protein n=1 Tax=Leclercia sp. Marseille-Q4284 TaxID=2866582 RepID=UPI001CE4A4FC|nr:VapE domain-containing protein [Leclercia sp. Marseille-Q4284]
MINRIWGHFSDQFGPSNIVPIALAREGVETTLPAGVLGKVPSIYNTHGAIVGFHDWQTCRAKMKDVERWAGDARYGFGVILGQPLPAGGVAVCIDVDTENEAHQATVEKLIRQALPDGLPLPMRVRTNSTRRAYVLAVDTADQITKRVLTLRKAVKAEGIKGEAVEILAYGQQFAAWGVHPSGADLEWLDAPADSMTAEACYPDMGQGGQRLSFEAFNALIDAIRASLPVIDDAEKSARQRAGKGAKVKPDDVAAFLDAEGWTLSTGSEGQRHIRSPFESEYTNEQAGSDTSVTYFLPGTRDYEQGHFVSHHASDATRTDADFLDAIGFVASQFETLPATTKPDGRSPSRPAFTQVQGGKLHDRIEATLLNVLAALGAPDWLGHYVAFDEFTGQLSIGGPGAWRPFRDTDYTRIRATLEAKGFLPVGKELARDAVHSHAEAVAIDTGKEWAASLVWDGIKRVAHFLPDYFGTVNDEYTRAVSMYMWTALAGRLLQPGIKADMMPVFIGAQGCGKSTGVEALAPARDFFAELSFHESDADQARKLRGVLVAEFAEMNGLRGRAIEAVKAMVTRTHDKWVQKYQEQATQYPRRSIFFGTSNDEELLDDPTGARRWLPVVVGTVAVDDIKADCAQLWAEAIVLFKKHGVAHSAAYMAGINARKAEEHRVTDPLEDVLHDWLDTPDDLDGSAPATRGWVTTSETLIALKGKNVRIEVDRAGQIRVAKALKSFGWTRKRRLINKRLVWGFEAPIPA